MDRYLILLVIAVYVAFFPAAAEITLFVPGSDSIPSLGVMDIVNGPHGSVIVATDNGRAVYTDQWEIIHIDRSNPKESSLGDFVTALEYDGEGNLWIGYSNGLQLYNGTGYCTVRDLQLLKNPNINAIERHHGGMWVATGHAGLHHVRSGVWQWYKPFGKGGLGAYEIRGMAVDYRADRLYAVSAKNGVWFFNATARYPSFEQLFCNGMPLSGMEGIKSDTMGGVYLFNHTHILHVDSDRSCELFTTVSAMPGSIGMFFDLAVDSDGSVVIATDDGIISVHEGKPRFRLEDSDGLGDNVIKTVFIDNSGRWWFVNRNFAGFYAPQSGEQLIPFVSPPAEEKGEPTPAESVPNSTGQDITLPPGEPDQKSGTTSIATGIILWIQQVWGQLRIQLPG
jgi:ligand-binding sensor domain-containing protein